METAKHNELLDLDSIALIKDYNFCFALYDPFSIFFSFEPFSLFLPLMITRITSSFKFINFEKFNTAAVMLLVIYIIFNKAQLQ